MKIPLNMGNNSNQSSKAAQFKILEREILATKKGDWNAKNNLIRTFTPLLTSLAEKRSSDPAQKNKLMDAGKEGLFNAARKYKESIGPDKFQIFALDFIESNMDNLGKNVGFFARLFGRG
jgi:DNA-directed RNA polymerase specialized sigma subunit